MKVTDFLVQYLIKKSVSHVFGYPGGVICHFMDSLTKFKEIRSHVTYNEQGAAFAACGYAQATHNLGVAFSTSGPGATNLITGVANAYFDSIPVLFITGQVDTYALNNTNGIRQRGFQETDVVNMVKPITKYAVRIDNPDSIKFYLEKAIFYALSGNPGPVLLDIPADVQRADINCDKLDSFTVISKKTKKCNIGPLLDALQESKRPVLLIGNGVKISNSINEITKTIETLNIPTISSLPSFDVLPYNHPNNFGFIGTNGHRYANFVFGKADLIISIGSRLDIRQIGLKRNRFLKGKKLVRIDIDQNQLNYKVVEEEIDYCVNIKDFILDMQQLRFDFSDWNGVCTIIKNKLIGYDDAEYNKIYSSISGVLPNNIFITLDVGQNQIWFAQSARLKGQRVYMSAGHGSMGYSLPAAIGVHFATGKEVYSFNGDGGLMMNIQELQFVKREKLPIKIVCFNNHALGMIRGFQERNFGKNYSLTTEKSGWQSPNFEKIAEAFGLPYIRIEQSSDVHKMKNLPLGPVFVEISYSGETNLIPNFGKTDFIQDQLPEIDKKLYEEIMKL